MCSEYDDIRPYTDAEIPAAMRQVAEWDLFPQMVRFIYPDAVIEEQRRHILGIDSVHRFQSTVMNDAIRRIIAETTDGFTFGGLHHLKRNEAYLFVSNHRDITLDAFLLQHVLLEHRGDTSHIVFGQNLLSIPMVDVLFRSNKLIRMERGGTPRAFYNSLQHLSSYLNKLITEEHQSVWIAQRNGRAKDGRDETAPAVIKMLTLGGGDSPEKTLERLHIVPMSISYEWDPCDAMKAAELYQSQYGTYTKSGDEDTRSVVNGIIGGKGRVHLEIGRPLKPREIAPPAGTDVADHVAALLDKRIQAGYRLMPTNYAAEALLGGRRHAGPYNKQTLLKLKARADAMPNKEMRQLLLEAYAAPLHAKAKKGN